MKILQVVTLSEVGGAQKVLYDIARGLNKKGFHFHAACAPGGEMVGWLKELGVPVFEIPELVRPISPINDYKALTKLRKIMKKGKYDLVHCHSSKAGILGRLAARISGVPRIVFTVHGWGVNDLQPIFMRSFLGFMERAAGWVSTDVVCVSRADYHLAKKFVNEKKLGVIYNGTDSPYGPEDLIKLGRKVRRELGIEEKEIIIGMVARLKKPKEPLFFLQAGEKIIESRGKGIHFVLAGSGPLWKDCDEFIRKRKLEKQVHLLGTREDMTCLYGAFDIFSLFSSWEGLPLTICEAMRARLPVVASRVGGVEEQVVHGWNGFLAEEGDMEKAVEYLGNLISDEKLRREMGSRSQMRGKEMFRLDRMVEEYGKLYRKIE